MSVHHNNFVGEDWGRKSPFLFMGYVISASTSAVPIHENTVDPIRKAVIEGAFVEDNYTNKITKSLLQGAVNPITQQLNSYYYAGQNEYSLGLPTQYVSRMRVTEDIRYAYLNMRFPDGYTIKKEEVIRDQVEPFITVYLYESHGFDNYTKMVTSMPSNFQATLDVTYNDFVTTSEQAVQDELTSLRNTLPVDRTVETPQIINDESVTLVEEYVTRSQEGYQFTPSQTAYTTYENYSVDLVDFIPTYTLNFRTYQTMRAIGGVWVSYQVTKTSYYRYADNTTSTPVVERQAAQQVSNNNLVYIHSQTLDYTDTFVPVIEINQFYLFFEVTTTIVDAEENEIETYHYVIQPLLSSDPGLEEVGLASPVEEVRITATDSQFYPVVYFINNETDLRVSNPTQVEENTALLKRVGLDYPTIADAIFENEDIDEIDEAYFMFGVRYSTDMPLASKKYLFNVFNDLLINSPQDNIIPLDANNQFVEVTRDFSTAIAIKEGGVYIGLSYWGIGSRYVQGRIGNVRYTETQFVHGGEYVWNDVLYIRQQIDEDTYQEIKLLHPFHQNTIYGDGTINTSIRDIHEDPENHNYLIPLRKDLVDAMTPYERQEITLEAMHLVFHAYEKRKTKWYESSIFKAIIFVVAIYVMVTTGIEIYTEYAMLSATVGAGVAGTTLAMVWLAQKLITMFTVSVVLRYTVKEVGLDTSFYIAVVGYLAYLYGWGTGTTLGNMTPDKILRLSTGLTSAIETQVQNEIMQLEKEYKAFFDSYTDLMQELEEKEKLLQPNELLDPYLFINNVPTIFPYETPDNYYKRSLMTDVMPYSIASIERYVDTQLTLPTLPQI